MNHSERIAHRAAYEGGLPFEPTGGVALAATDTSGRVALVGDGDQVFVSNLDATQWAHIKFGGATVVATVANQAIRPADQVLLTIPSTSDSGSPRATYVAAITATGETVALQFETGWGI
jgi:hypothetical protein